MKSAIAYLMIFCVIGAFIGLWIIGLPEAPPKPRVYFPDTNKMVIDAEQDRLLSAHDARIRKLESVIGSK